MCVEYYLEYFIFLFLIADERRALRCWEGKKRLPDLDATTSYDASYTGRSQGSKRQ